MILRRARLGLTITILTASAAGGCFADNGSDWHYGPENASPPAGPRVLTVAAGSFHTCALLQGGIVRCWGGNYFGELGVAPTNAEACDVPGLPEVTDLTSGGSHTCALLSDQTVRCWGNNFASQLGVLDRDEHWGPVVVDGLTDVISVDAGASSTCAVRADGTVWCWGGFHYNSDTNEFEEIPPGITQLADATEMVQVSVGFSSACTVNASGKVWCWTETYDPLRVPSQQPELQDVQRVVVARYHSVTLFEDTTVARFNPGQMPVWVTGFHEVTDLCAGEYYTCAVRQEGTVHCWGINGHGQLGDGTLQNQPLPVQVPGIVDASSVNCGYGHTCAVHASGAVSCWGWNASGQLGDGTVSSHNRPVWVTAW